MASRSPEGNSSFSRASFASLHELELTSPVAHSYSQSGLRDRMVWFVAPWQDEDKHGKARTINADTIRKRFGVFDKISHQPAKLGARYVDMLLHSADCLATDRVCFCVARYSQGFTSSHATEVR